ncbi:alpha/beta hydrolase [Thermomonospora cellulosilytica]|uniref:Acetyl esterase/lipase n=1 Tax=Thermomonospora cellulosilytica TaxID=1411118 RepID=A0A7W3MXD6_9ACTN|nr:alpha/beta hydrolase [Thermomonospora cellulosilytica]MBA9003604.1 acetyl esterase/lipase [Thermomonospora cellulosilytica]
MRKAMVYGTALAAVTLSAAVVPAEAGTRPSPPATAPPSTTAPPSARPPASDGTVTARAVMITPELPNTRTYAYGPAERQRLDAYWHDADRRRPGVLVVHGGYWRSGDKSDWRYAARKLAGRGYVVFAANYRLIPARWPAQRADLTAALAYIKRNARRWNLDPDRIVVVGSSAGGHLATQLGTLGEGGARVRGVVALSPVVSLERAYHDGVVPGADRPRRRLRQAVRELLGCDPEAPDADTACFERMEDASPTSHAGTGDAPMLLMHGADEFVPAVHGRMLASVLNSAGVQATVQVLPGNAHGGALLRDPARFDAMARWIDRTVGR